MTLFFPFKMYHFALHHSAITLSFLCTLNKVIADIFYLWRHRVAQAGPDCETKRATSYSFLDRNAKGTKTHQESFSSFLKIYAKQPFCRSIETLSASPCTLLVNFLLKHMSQPPPDLQNYPPHSAFTLLLIG